MLPGMVPLGRKPGETNAPRDGVDLDGATEYLQLTWSNFGGGAGIAPTSNTKFTIAFWVAARGGNGPAIYAMAGSVLFAVYLQSNGALYIYFYDTRDGGYAQMWTAAGTIPVDGTTKTFVMVAVDLSLSSMRLWLGAYGGTVSEYTNWEFEQTINGLQGVETLNHGAVDCVDSIGSDGGSSFFNGVLGDVYWIDGQTITDPSEFARDYGAGLRPVAYQGAYGNTGYHLDFADDNDPGHDASGNGFDFTPSPGTYVAGSPIDVSGCTPIGNFSTRTANAFDGNTNQAAAACAQSASSSVRWIGVDLTAIENQTGSLPDVFKVIVHGANDQGFCSSANPVTTLYLRGQNGETPPAAWSDGTLINQISFTDTSNEGAGRELVNTGGHGSKYRWLWVAVYTATSNVKNVAELALYDTVQQPSLDASDRIVGWLSGAPAGGGGQP